MAQAAPEPSKQINLAPSFYWRHWLNAKKIIIIIIIRNWVLGRPGNESSAIFSEATTTALALDMSSGGSKCTVVG